MRKVPLQDKTYVVGSLDVFQQLHLARKIAPVMNTMGISIAELARSGKEAFLDQARQLSIYASAMEVVAHMSEEDVDDVVQRCMTVVKRLDENGMAQPVATGKTMLFDDIRLPALIQLCIAVLQENVGDFFPLLNGADAMQLGSVQDQTSTSS